MPPPHPFPTPSEKDSSTALTIMKLLSDVAARGTTVMCSLHQPRPQAFNLLDGVLLMSRGRVAFFGPPSSVAEHFVSIGRPFGGAVDASGEGGEVGNADAMLDAVAEAEGVEDDRVSAVTGTGGDRAEEEKEGDGNGAEEEKGFSSACDHVDGEGTLVMPRDFLIEKVWLRRWAAKNLVIYFYEIDGSYSGTKFPQVFRKV